MKDSCSFNPLSDFRMFLEPFAELHADLFSRHASPLEVDVFVAVANRGEDIMSDEICRRFNGSVCSSQTGL